MLFCVFMMLINKAMSELKNFWDNMDSSKNIDEERVEASLHKINTRISRRQQAIRTMAISIAALPIIAIVLIFTGTTNSEKSQIYQCYAPYGEKSTLSLEDGTRIDLNAGSTLIYEQGKKKGERRVILVGQATFDVAKNPKRPFIVRTKDFDVQVLGTRFDVKAYPEDNESAVVLDRGSVKIVRDEEETLLTPGQCAKLSASSPITISKVNSEDYLSWHDGGFVFRQASFMQIVSYIERTYGVTIRCGISHKFDFVSITARQDSGLELNDFLNLLCELIPDMEYSIKDKTITLF